MTHLMEPVAVPVGPDKTTHDDHCVFCKDAVAKGATSYIGAENDSTTLGNKLAAAGQKRRTFKHSKHGNFSSEPHHLMPGNEALKGHGIEKWFATKASGSKLKKDTGFDINSHYNGAWLPSVPESYVGVSGWNWREASCQRMALDVVLQENLQFHKGGHTNKGGLDRAGSEPDRCYIQMVKGRLTKLLEHVDEWKDDHCPVAKKKKPKEKFDPPVYLNDLAYRYVSAWMMKEVSGAPEKWKVFISRLSYAAHLEAKKNALRKRRLTAARKKTAKRRRTR